MMSKQIKVLLAVALTLSVFARVTPTYAADVVINDFEGTAGNALDWGSTQDIDTDPNYSYESVIGVTSGSQSVHLDGITEWAQTLALRLDEDQRVAFLANDLFKIDITVPQNFPGSTSGWIEIYQVYLNADGYSFTGQFSTTPVYQFGFWTDSPPRTFTLMMDYRAVKASITANPNWIEIIFATNSDGAHTDLYFDNARLATLSSFNDFEGVAGNAFDWESGLDVDTDPNYSYDSAVGVTSGLQSLKLTDLGLHQTLAFELTPEQRTDFLVNSFFSIDYSVAPDAIGVGGYVKIDSIAINADGLGWANNALGDSALFYFWNGSPERTETLMFDYSALKGSINPNPSYLQIVLTTNGQRDTVPAGPFELYFDNAQLLPGPACEELLSDITGDCRVDIADFAALSATWLECNDPNLIGIDLDCVATW